MQRFEFTVKGNVLIVDDLVNNGSLRITCKPLSKPEISPVLTAWNDLETSINNGDLYLSLHGINTIQEVRGFNLKGEVDLKSSHLHDPVIFNSRLDMSSIRAKVTIMNSELTRIGITHFGEVTFNECNLEHNYIPIPRNRRINVVYFQNRIVEI
uniref:LRR containing protein n=1 Tax=Pantoea phage Survivor TaxID=3232176 RepID=A0AAU8L0B0_9CAUD